MESAEAAGAEVVRSASEAMGHGLAAILPGIGPAAAKAGEDIGAGKTGQGLGEATGLIGSIVAPELAGKVTSAVLPKSASAVDRVVAATNPPTKTAGDFLQHAQSAVPELQKMIDSGMTSPRDLAGVKLLTEQAGEKLENTFQSTLDPVRDVKLDTTPVADAIESKITRYVEQKYPDIAEKIRENASFYRDKQMTLGELDDFRRGINGELESFYTKNNLNRAAALKDPTVAHQVAEADAIRDLEYNTLREQTGADMKSLKRLQGSIRDIHDAAEENLNKLTLRDARLRGQVITTKFWDVAKHVISVHPVVGIRQLASNLFGGGSWQLDAANRAAKSAFDANKGAESGVGGVLKSTLKRGVQAAPATESQSDSNAAAILSGSAR